MRHACDQIRRFLQRLKSVLLQAHFYNFHILLLLETCSIIMMRISSNNLQFKHHSENYLNRKAQFLLSRNSQKSGASRVCITFPQITQTILTKDIIHRLELSTEILIFLQIFCVRKTTTHLF